MRTTLLTLLLLTLLTAWTSGRRTGTDKGDKAEETSAADAPTPPIKRRPPPGAKALAGGMGATGRRAAAGDKAEEGAGDAPLPVKRRSSPAAKGLAGSSSTGRRAGADKTGESTSTTTDTPTVKRRPPPLSSVLAAKAEAQAKINGPAYEDVMTAAQSQFIRRQRIFLERWIAALSKEEDMQEGRFVKTIEQSWSGDDYFNSYNRKVRYLSRMDARRYVLTLFFCTRAWQLSELAEAASATLFFVSVGACDGTEDPTIKLFLKHRHWEGLFVEPMDLNVRDLQNMLVGQVLPIAYRTPHVFCSHRLLFVRRPDRAR